MSSEIPGLFAGARFYPKLVTRLSSHDSSINSWRWSHRPQSAQGHMTRRWQGRLPRQAGWPPPRTQPLPRPSICVRLCYRPRRSALPPRPLGPCQAQQPLLSRCAVAPLGLPRLPTGPRCGSPPPAPPAAPAGRWPRNLLFTGPWRSQVGFTSPFLQFLSADP